jgi:hypothetical protein
MWILASLDGHDIYKTKTNRYCFESHDFQLARAPRRRPPGRRGGGRDSSAAEPLAGDS